MTPLEKLVIAARMMGETYYPFYFEGREGSFSMYSLAIPPDYSWKIDALPRWRRLAVKTEDLRLAVTVAEMMRWEGEHAKQQV